MAVSAVRILVLSTASSSCTTSAGVRTAGSVSSFVEHALAQG